jgi:hypothetical protein
VDLPRGLRVRDRRTDEDKHAGDQRALRRLSGRPNKAASIRTSGEDQSPSVSDRAAHARRTPLENVSGTPTCSGVPSDVEQEKWRILPVGEVRDQPVALAGDHRSAGKVLSVSVLGVVAVLSDGR